MEIIAGALGCLAGVLGVLPFVLIGAKIRKMVAEKGSKAFKFVLLMPPLSFILMLAAILLFAQLVPEQVLIFAIACAVVFVLAIVVYAVLQFRSIREEREK